MASSSTNACSTSLNRSTPVILTITGAAAVYGCYLYYTSYAQINTSPIRRRGALHRHRNRPTPANHSSSLDNSNQINRTDLARTIDWDGTAEYGQISLTGNDTTIRWQLQLQKLPSIRHVAQRYDIDLSEAASLRRAIHTAYVRSWLQQNAPFDSTWDSDQGGGPYTPSAVSQKLQVLGLEPAAVDIAIDEYLERQSPDTARDADSTREDQTGGPEEDQREEAEEEDEDEDTWTIAETQALPDGDTILPTSLQQLTSSRDGQGLKEMLYHIAEQQSRDDNYIHRGITCNSCDTRPIRGIRWHCANCADYDLCSDCESHALHDKTHVFFKIRIPAPYIYSPRTVLPLTYPGKPTGMDRGLAQGLRKRLTEETMFEMQELDALYEQFSCLAATAWKEDPDDIGMAIDWAAYSKALMPQSAHNVPLPNLIYERVFAFYDSDGNSLIGFSEFIKGCAVLHKKERGPSSRLRRIFEGYDLGGNGYLCREDFLKMFRANYVLQREFVLDLVAVEASMRESLQAGGEEIVQSAQPLSAAFPEHIEVDPRRRVVEVKGSNSFGDRRIEEPYQEDGKDEGNAEEIAAEALDVDDRMPSRGGSHDRQSEILRSSIEGIDHQQAARTDSQAEAEASGDITSATANTHTRQLLYLASLQAINELLNPLFKHREQLAAQVLATAAERHRRRSSVARWTAAREEEKTKRRQQVADDPLVATARAQPVNGSFETGSESAAETNPEGADARNLASTETMGDADVGLGRVVLNVEQRVNDSSLEDLLRDLGAAPMNLMLTNPNEEAIEGVRDEDSADTDDLRDQSTDPSSTDPTLPHNRPSSPTVAQPQASSTSAEDLLNAIFSPHASPPQPSNPNKYEAQTSDSKTDAHYSHLQYLNTIEAEASIRGGPARISYEEFAAVMETSRGLGFVESWLELANF